MLSINSINVDLGGRRVLTDAELSVKGGDFVALLGPNGAGKTTLLRSILGLVPLCGGSITLDGVRSDRNRRRFAYVPQRHEFTWDYPISVEQAVLTGRFMARSSWRRPGRADYRAAADALARVRLDDLGDRTVGELSGGQRQRVLVARALVGGGDVMLLDEPFTGLDFPTQELLAALFSELAADGHSVVMATHDLLAAVTNCEQLALINGTVIAHGAPGDLRDPGPWQDACGVAADSPLLRLLREF